MLVEILVKQLSKLSFVSVLNQYVIVIISSFIIKVVIRWQFLHVNQLNEIITM